ncbi:MAG: CHAT domain-containing protein [Steroidobacteraceae bacterium]|nr:CHAT domain-containing protein [Steroidobacteraceae bacterium]
MLVALAPLVALTACSRGFDSEPLVEFSTEIVVQGSKPHSVSRHLPSGTYLLEIRERDIDLSVRIDAGPRRIELADAYLRHGLHRTVVSLDEARSVRISLTNAEHRGWRGGAAIRILRWPKAALEGGPDRRLSGFIALGEGNELVARGTPEDWRAAIEPMRRAAAHFREARDLRSLAETDYQRGNIEFDLLLDFQAARASAMSAIVNYRLVGDATGVARANLLLGLAEVNLAGDKAPQELRAQLGIAHARFLEALRYFETEGHATDAMHALNLSAIRELRLGNYAAIEKIYEQIRARARARNDLFFEIGATQNLAFVTSRGGDLARAVAMYESVLPHIDRVKQANLYATVASNLGTILVSLGDFDRALLLQTEALELFSARGELGQTARALSSLAAIQFRTGNLKRALESLRAAQPLYERSADLLGYASALRMAGNAASELGQNDLALEYLRRAESLVIEPDLIERIHVNIARELRILGDLRGAEQRLASVMLSKNEYNRANALTERARLRQRQHRDAEAVADLRAADSTYSRLQLDFNRIDTSTALALALLDSGDVDGAAIAADTAVGIERRIRVKSANPEMRAGFLSASYAPYEARIEVDLAQSTPRDVAASWKAFRTAEAVRARSLTDRIAHLGRAGGATRDVESDRLREKMTALQVELERRMRRPAPDDTGLPELRREVAETRARLEARNVARRRVEAGSGLGIPESLAEVQAALPVDTAVLAYFVGDRRSHAWLLTRSELRRAALPGRRALQDLVNAFVERQRAGRRSNSESTSSPILGGLLANASVKRLVILPDGPLNGLPFAALPIPGAAHEILIDRFVISAAPSLELALSDPPRRDPSQTRVAVISDPVYTPDDRRLTVASDSSSNYRGAEDSDQRLARLPYSAIEARAVVQTFEEADVIELAGFNATARRVIELPSQDLAVLHFATHARASEDAPEQSALFLSEYAADGSALAADRLTADDIARSGLRAGIVVLSGCATGDGRELRGEGVLGLTYGFLANGSRTVVASLWPVEDALTAQFMEEFYTAYKASGRAADALRTAQLRTRGIAGSAVWSSFVVRANGLQ